MPRSPAIAAADHALLQRDARIELIVSTLQRMKALDITLLDLRPVSDAADYFIICTGTSDPHIRSLARELDDQLRHAGHRPWHVEGMASRRWILVDLVDVVVHIFRGEARQFYALERLWGDAASTRFDDAWSEDEVLAAGISDDA